MTEEAQGGDGEADKEPRSQWRGCLAAFLIVLALGQLAVLFGLWLGAGLNETGIGGLDLPIALGAGALACVVGAWASHVTHRVHGGRTIPVGWGMALILAGVAIAFGLLR